MSSFKMYTMATQGGRGRGRGPGVAAGSTSAYGQPANPGRAQAMPGRGGRMPGRGRGMPGRGRMQGRGGRGGRMQMPAGRGGRMQMPAGRGGRGGRMMMPGRGRGGRGPRVPCKLDAFNRFIGFKIFRFLERDDHELLGAAFPQFKPAPLTQEQQKMMMKKKMKEEIHSPYGTQVDDPSSAADAADQEDKKTTDTCDSDQKVAENGDENSNEDSVASKKEESPADDAVIVNDKNDNTVSEFKIACNVYVALTGGDENIPPSDASCVYETRFAALRSKADPCNCRSCREKKIEAIQACDCNRCDVLKSKLTEAPILSQNDSNPKQSIEAEIDPEKKKEMMKKREEAMRLNMTDCHTLLAKLNTKRLYRRIKHFRGIDPNYDVDKAYPYNKNTAEISQIEWEALVKDYQERVIKQQKQRQIEEAERAEREANNPRKPKKKKKKKKGKGKKSGGKVKKATPQEVVEEAEVEPELEDEPSLEDEVDNEDDGTHSISDSDDESIEAVDFEYVGDKPSSCELLMFTPCPRAVAVLASYPRSGNSLMRNLYEKITLRVTGSDMMGGLQKHDLVGEMATGTNNVQFVKTHYPERQGNPPFRVSRAVLLVRNPYDAMDSYFNLMSTSTHTTSLSPEARKKYAKLFADMARKEILVWRDFHEYWLKQKIPLMVVRYEDLIRDTVKVVNKVIQFVLEVKSMTFFEDRIQRAIGEEQVENLGPYKARSGGIGKSLTKGHYTPQLLHQINYGIVGTMEMFGYKEMLIPKPSSWKLTPLDQHGVFIPGSNNGQPLVINQKGLVRGPNRQTNWMMVKKMIEKDKQDAEKQKEDATPKSVDLN